MKPLLLHFIVLMTETSFEQVLFFFLFRCPHEKSQQWLGVETKTIKTEEEQRAAQIHIHVVMIETHVLLLFCSGQHCVVQSHVVVFNVSEQFQNQFKGNSALVITPERQQYDSTDNRRGRRRTISRCRWTVFSGSLVVPYRSWQRSHSWCYCRCSPSGRSLCSPWSYELPDLQRVREACFLSPWQLQFYLSFWSFSSSRWYNSGQIFLQICFHTSF